MTDFVIYNPNNTMEISSHKTLRGAKISLAALNKRIVANRFRQMTNEWCRNPLSVLDAEPLACMTDRDDYNKNVVYMKEVTNLMSGKKVMEPSNTPNYCSVASEAYWSM